MKSSSKLRKAAEGRHVSGVSLHGGLERPLCEAMKFKPGLHWKTQDISCARVVGYLSKRAANKK